MTGMNQRITPLQVLELNQEQKNNLRLRWTPKEGDYVAVGEREELVYYVNGIEKHKTLPLLSCGELIELLIQHNSKLQMTYNGHTWSVTHGEWECTNKEFRNALWDLTKKVL